MSDHQNLRTTQLVQDYHPVLRRRAYTSIRTSFPTYFTTQSEQQSPLPSMNQSQKIIYQNFTKINHIIDVVDQHIRKRIQCYQNEVVNVVQKQIQQMRQETQKVVIQFNNMILQKNKQTEIWSLNNQLDYFKSQAKKLYQSNKQLKKQHAEIKKKLQQYEWELQNRQVIMQKLLYKYQKQKNSKNRLKQKMDLGVQMIQQQVKKKKSICGNIDNKDGINNKEMVRLQQKKNSRVEEKDQTMKQIYLHTNEANNEQQHLQNSLLHINIDDEDQLADSQQQSEIQQSKLIHLTNSNNNHYQQQHKPKQVDQQSQVNIYLSQHSYKTLFQKKPHHHNSTKKSFYSKKVDMKQISTQTQPINFNYERRKLQNQTKQTTLSPKTKSTHIIKNGFTIKQGSIHNNHLRSYSHHMNSTMKRQTYINGFTSGNQRKQRINTQMNFHHKKQKSPQQQFQFQLLTPKAEKTFYTNQKSKLFNKMANKFQRNKIAQRAYEKTHEFGGKKQK